VADLNDSQLPPPTYPLKVGPTGRYLVDQTGTPVLLQGDFGWSLVVSTTRDEVLRYLLDRQRKGFNAIYLGLIDHLFSYDPPRNWYGDDPFTTPGDFSTPNEAYFAYADWVIQKAAETGLCVFIAPSFFGYRAPGGSDAYGGYQTRAEGWYADVLANGVDGCYEYGRYVGRRYGRVDNLVWVMAGDRCPGEALEHVRSMARGILEEDPRHLVTAHVHPGCKPYEQFPDDSWLTLSNTYTYDIVHRELLADYNANPGRPSFLLESTFEGEHNASAVQIRRQAYWAILLGACGQFMGNLPTWHFSPGWTCGLDSPGSWDMARLGGLFNSMRWWDLVPDQEHLIVVGGLGEFRGLDYCAAAATPDGSLAVAYLPATRRITVDLARLVGARVAATWFDPATADRYPAGEHPTAGFADFAPPPGDHDWVLVLEATSDGRHAEHDKTAAPIEPTGSSGEEQGTGETAPRTTRNGRRQERRES
jgi:hypothetical protein